MTTRLVYQKGSSHKFWEIERSGCETTVRYGRVGSEPRSSTKSHASDAEAIDYVREKTDAKLAKGYAPAPGAGPSSAAAPAEAAPTSPVTGAPPAAASGPTVTGAELAARYAAGARDFAGVVLADEMWEQGGRTASLAGADLRGADFSEKKLYNLDFSGAKLMGANLSGTYCVSCSFRGADLSGANLDLVWGPSDFTGTNLRGASLRGARKLQAKLEEADLREAHLEERVFGPRASLRGADLRGAHVAGTRFFAEGRGGTRSGTKMPGANLSGLDLSGKCFVKADLTGADLSKANLRDAIFERTRLAGADLRGVDAVGMRILDGCDLTGVRYDPEGSFADRLAEAEAAALEKAEAARRRAEKKRRKRRAKQVAACRAAFGEGVAEADAYAIDGVALARMHALPASLTEHIDALLALEARWGLKMDVSKWASKIVVFRKRPEQDLSKAAAKTKRLKALFAVVKDILPEAMKHATLDPRLGWTAGKMKKRVGTVADPGAWMRGMVLPAVEFGASDEAAGAVEARDALLSKIEPIVVPLLGDEVTAYPVTNENDENTETGVYLLVGAEAALLWCRRWIL